MKILVVDEESPTRDWLRRMLAETGGEHELAGEAADGWQAIACCRSQPIDLVLLDIQLPGMSGLEAVQQLARLERPPAVILMTTGEPSGSAETEPGVAGCLAKPVRREHLEEALQLARRLQSPTPSGEAPPATAPDAPAQPQRRTTVSAHYRGGLRSVAVDDILYLRADHKYVTVRHLAGELLVDESLRSFELEFPDLFLRIHRNALVSRSRLLGLEKRADGATLACLEDCPERLAISRRHLADTRRWLRLGKPLSETGAKHLD